MFVLIFLLPFIGLLCGILVKNMLPHKKISYVELMPPFLISCVPIDYIFPQAAIFFTICFFILSYSGDYGCH